MKTLYIECNMGAAGDMLMAALLELHHDPAGFLDRINALGLPGVHIDREPSVKCGVQGSHVRVVVHGEEECSADVPPEGDAHLNCHHHMHAHEEGHSHDHAHGSHDHHHAGLGGILDLIERLPLPESVRKNAQNVYRRIAEAEAHVHGSTPEHIHFHEVGTLDAVADVVGVCLLMEELGAEVVVVSPICVGFGEVRCAHGILPVPAPATAWLLRNAPFYAGRVRGELCTPTGAALLTHFATSFGEMPPMQVRSIGYGMGSKDFEAANCVRAMLGESLDQSSRDAIVRLECNLDDMTGEEIGCAMERLFEAGALDVFVEPIQMKKNRPAQMLCCICTPSAADGVARAMLFHTSTLGVRRQDMERYVLERRVETRHTAYGEVRVKYAEGYGVRKYKPEYADVEAIALREGRPFNEIYRSIVRELS